MITMVMATVMVMGGGQNTGQGRGRPVSWGEIYLRFWISVDIRSFAESSLLSGGLVGAGRWGAYSREWALWSEKSFEVEGVG
jgi:hypothetical protein